MKKLTLLFAFALMTLTGCADNLVERAVEIQAEALNFVCECGTASGTYANRAACDADNPQLAPFSAAQQDCLERVLDGSPSADVDAIECGFDASEEQLSCVQSLGCEPEQSALQACGNRFEAAFDACPMASELTQSMFATCGGGDDG